MNVIDRAPGLAASAAALRQETAVRGAPRRLDPEHGTDMREVVDSTWQN
jgi:hypothetical protein